MRRSVQPQGIVSSFDPLCEVQSDKASVEITSPFDGVVKQLLVQEGHIAKVGEGLCVIEIEEDGDESSAPPPAPAGTPKSVGESRDAASTEKATEGSYTPPSATRKHHPMDPARPASTPTPTSTSSQGGFEKGSNQALATPSVRHYARSRGISDLDVIGSGSGRGGRIERSDVDAFLDRSSKGAGAAASSSGSAAPAGEEVVVEMGRTRWGMWKSMTKVRSAEVSGVGLETDGSCRV